MWKSQNSTQPTSSIVSFPRNIIATDQVWCINCAAYHPLDTIDAHLRKHAACSSSITQQQKQPSSLQPQDIDIELKASELHHFNESEISTMSACYIPEVQTERKKINKPTSRPIQPDCDRVPEVFLPVPSDVTDLPESGPSDVTMLQEVNVTDEYYQEVNIQRMYVQVPQAQAKQNAVQSTRKKG